MAVRAVPLFETSERRLHTGLGVGGAAGLADDFVAPEDIEQLVVPIFQHRMELVPGVEDATQVIKEVIKQPLDVLAKNALRGR